MKLLHCIIYKIIGWG